MSRDGLEIEKLLRITKENQDPAQDQSVSFLFGTGVPGGDTGEQDAAFIGSFYLKTQAPVGIYQKKLNVGATSDWELNGNSTVQIGAFRPEQVCVVTNDTQGVGVRDVDASPFADDDAPALTAADFIVGKYIISDADGTPALLEITDVTGNNVTFAAASTALAADDTFVARNYLPDSPNDQEAQAIVQYDGSNIIKLGDVNWDIATGINLSGAFAAINGIVAAGDSVELAIAKLVGNQDDIQAALGIAQGSVDFGTFTGSTLSDNQTAKQLFQEIETALENAAGNNTAGPLDIAQNTPTTVDTVLVDEVQMSEWEVTAHDIGDPTKVKTLKIEGIHNGHAGADATDVKDKVDSKIRIGGNFNLQASVVLSGTGAAQTMGLELETSDADGIRYTVRRTDVPAL